MARRNVSIGLLMIMFLALGHIRAEATTVTLSPDHAAPQPVGTLIRWTASASGGTAPYSFKWWLYDGSGWKVLRDWNTSPVYEWSPALANSAYRVGVWVRSAGNASDGDEANEGAYFAITAASSMPLATGVTLTPDRAAPQALGATITWTAQPAGGVAPHSYKWWLYDGSSWSVLRDWGTGATYAWTPSTASSAYRVGVWVRSAGSTSDVDEANQGADFAVSSATSRVSAVALVADRTAPQPVGTSTTFTATPTGGTAPYSYKWWLYNGTQWNALGDWSAGPSFTWSAASANTAYRVGVWVRSAGNTSDVDEANVSIAFPVDQIAKVTSVTLTSDRTAPQPAGTTVRWTAHPTGGAAPVSYKWWVYDGLAWSVLSDWGTSDSVSWTASRPNEAFRIGVWARPATNTTDVDEANVSEAFPVRGGVPDCLQMLEPAVVTMGSGGGSGSTRVTPAESACSWDVRSQATWISVSSPTSGTGDGTVAFTVAPNVDRVSRTGFVMIGAKALSVTQGGVSSSGGCTYAVFPTVLDVGFGNESAEVAVTAPAGCAWSATGSDFVQLTPANGMGSGTLRLSIENNTAQESRGVAVTVAGRAVTVTQAGLAAQTDGCAYSVSPSEASFDFRAGTGTIAVSAPDGCAWTAAAASPFVHLTGATSGQGAGSVPYAIDVNGTSAPRSGLVMVAGEAVTLAQAPAATASPCVFTLSALSASVSYAGGSGALWVSTTADCEWNVASHTEWLRVTEISAASGDGSVWFSVDGNSGSPRAGTLVVAGQTFTVSQGPAPVSASADEIEWVTPPDPERVGHCEGNCGAGCGTFFNPCGGPHYWEREVLSTPQYVGDDWEPVCADGSSWFVVRPRYTAIVRWTYHGLKSSNCEAHDASCRALGFLPFPIDQTLCLATAGLVGLNGLNYCDDARSFDWAYEFVDVGHGAAAAYIDGATSCN